MIDMEEKIQPVYKREPEENPSKDIEKGTELIHNLSERL